MAVAQRNWLPTLAVWGALLIGCVVAWRSYERHQQRMLHPAAPANRPAVLR